LVGVEVSGLGLELLGDEMGGLELDLGAETGGLLGDGEGATEGVPLLGVPPAEGVEGGEA